ncbi:Hypothetical protein CINCED_3A002293 [Cinara cedri]|uniref:Uncharacterized protein n=1 Tax=Cinara cedri TaxID=506608 RepID=A0A5E4N1L8_9HEMI|nr:Hypothetical protein CINCED_3A002293 [Cinara cedri]
MKYRFMRKTRRCCDNGRAYERRAPSRGRRNTTITASERRVHWSTDVLLIHTTSVDVSDGDIDFGFSENVDGRAYAFQCGPPTERFFRKSVHVLNSRNPSERCSRYFALSFTNAAGSDRTSRYRRGRLPVPYDSAAVVCANIEPISRFGEIRSACSPYRLGYCDFVIPENKKTNVTRLIGLRKCFQ